MMKASEIRSRFIEYFKKHQHTHVPSSRLVPENDSTLLFTNSGMVQFKNLFLGTEKRNYARATTHQKCVRAGGKHNDLDNVGFTARHHTFFEMLGNFSFGNYFKKEAIHYAWDFLTSDLKIPTSKLYVTVFREDDEAAEIWEKQERVPKDRISRFDEKDNFWQMGDTGPCGPCSEIFYDHGPEHGCGKSSCKVGCSCDRFVEIWNLVFMQFEKDSSGKTTPLPKPSIDTGAGLERIAACMQGVPSNYQTDLFLDLIKVMEKISGHRFVNDMSEKNVAMRVMADHARSSSFLIADGVLPSNEGAGYVLRRIMRRGIRYGRKLTDKSLIVPICEEVIKTMTAAYPELHDKRSLILETIEAEEKRFIATLDQGTEILSSAIREVQRSGKKVLSGEIVFKLYDTFGFPFDLTELMAKESGLSVDSSGFEKLMETQKQTARASWKGAGGADDLLFLQRAAQGLKPTKFTGYENLDGNVKVTNIFSNSSEISELQGSGVLVFDTSPFYAEGGGQVGDQGIFKTESASGEVLDTKKFGDVWFHFVNVKSGVLKKNQIVEVSVNPERRNTMRNHSATHLMHAALRKVLGTHVTQKGSLVDSQRTRFDFSHPKPMTAAEIKAVEAEVNEVISLGKSVRAESMSYDKAIEKGAMALFGEKYGDEVRVISMGGFSTELCGGTHVSSTSDIRLFKILSESGVSSGVRRIEAVTGSRAIEYFEGRDQKLKKIEELLKSDESAVVDRLSKVLDQQKKLEKDFKQALLKGPATNVDDLLKSAIQKGGVKVLSQCVDIDDREVLSQLADKLKDKLGSGVLVLVGKSQSDNPSPIIVTVTKDLVSKFHAGNILKEVAGIMGGKGGGRPDFAQGAGPLTSKAEMAVQKVFDLVK